MKFKDLNVNEEFEFDHRDIGCLGMVHGPWRKISSRQYIRVGDPILLKVGSVNVNVIKAGSCKGGV